MGSHSVVAPAAYESYNGGEPCFCPLQALDSGVFNLEMSEDETPIDRVINLASKWGGVALCGLAALGLISLFL